MPGRVNRTPRASGQAGAPARSLMMVAPKHWARPVALVLIVLITVPGALVVCMGLAMLANLPGLDALSRYTGTEDVLFRVRKNLFETLAFVAHSVAGR